MSDELPPSQESPGQSPASDAATPSSGSLIAGIALAWAIVVGGGVLVFALVSSLGAAVFTVPLGVCVVLAIVMIARGQSRTGAGILLGLLSMAAVLLLLIAACFGIMRGSHFD